jgi:hypothetical protein
MLPTYFQNNGLKAIAAAETNSTLSVSPTHTPSLHHTKAIAHQGLILTIEALLVEIDQISNRDRHPGEENKIGEPHKEARKGIWWFAGLLFEEAKGERGCTEERQLSRMFGKKSVEL